MISGIDISHMRSLAGNAYDFGPGISVVCGANGSGKTTLLEAVYLLSQGFSFRAHELKELEMVEGHLQQQEPPNGI